MKLIGPAVFAAALLVPGAASADDGTIATLKETVQQLEARAQAVRDRADKSHSALLKKESSRIVAVVDAERIFLATRLQLFGLLGDAEPSEELIADTSARVGRVDRLMALVEHWFGKR
jgi:hypothetical protein